MNIQNYRILVSGLMGRIYLARPLKSKIPTMSSDRRLVDESEFIQAIEQWAKAKLKQGHKTVEITEESGKVTMSIVFP